MDRDNEQTSCNVDVDHRAPSRAVNAFSRLRTVIPPPVTGYAARSYVRATDGRRQLTEMWKKVYSNSIRQAYID